MVYYKNAQLAKNSRAHQLYQEWQKSKDPKDKRALDQHLKELEANEAHLLTRYTLK